MKTEQQCEHNRFDIWIYFNFTFWRWGLELALKCFILFLLLLLLCNLRELYRWREKIENVENVVAFNNMMLNLLNGLCGLLSPFNTLNAKQKIILGHSFSVILFFVPFYKFFIFTIRKTINKTKIYSIIIS